MHPALPALLDRLIPPDEFPGATQNGVLHFWDSILDEPARTRHAQALGTLDSEAQARFARPFSALQVLEQDEILDDLEAGRARADWPFEPRAWLLQAANLAAEGFYADPSNGANLNRASWEMVGFRRTIELPLVQENLLAARQEATAPAPARTGGATSATPSAPDLPSSVPAGNIAPTPGGADHNALEAAGGDGDDRTSSASTWGAKIHVGEPQDAGSFDAIIIGAGAGGGAAACVLSEAGLRVLVLERGRDLAFDDVARDHIRSQRLPLYGHNAGPDFNNPRVSVSPRGDELTVLPWQGGYSNNAACIGGGTRVYGAQAWRFMLEDFRMASLYGVPEGSSQADWPLSYEDLESWYERAERDMGVCGDGAAMHASHAPRAHGFPMPPLQPLRRTPILRAAAESLGWSTFPTPLAIASRDYRGRLACVRCTECVGFACTCRSSTFLRQLAIWYCSCSR